MKPKKRISIEEAFNILQLEDRSILAKMASAKKYEDACTALEEMKEIIKKQKRILSKKYHPDVGGDAEKFKEMIELTDALLDLKVQIRRPQPTFRVIIRTHYESYTATDSTTSSMWWTTF